MNDILLQKILDLLRDGLAHVGNFFKDLFVSDPQDGQIIAYDEESGHWINTDAAAVELDLTNTFEDQAVATITDAANGISMKSLVCNIVATETGTGTKSPSNPYTISGWVEVVITQTGSNVDTTTITLPDTIYGGTVDVPTGKLNVTYVSVDLGSVNWNYSESNEYFYTTSIQGYENGTHFISDIYTDVGVASLSNLNNYEGTLRPVAFYVKNTDYTDPALFKTAMSGHIFVYKLGTPIVSSITPTPIKTQGGNETISADSGDVSGEYYTKTAESVLALANITEDITSSITKNTTDFSDILLKVSQNNKVVSVEIYSASTSAAFNGTFLSGLPKPAMNSKVLLANTTLGEDGIILGTLKTTGDLDITTSGAKTFSGLITYVAK